MKQYQYLQDQNYEEIYFPLIITPTSLFFLKNSLKVTVVPVILNIVIITEVLNNYFITRGREKNDI